MQINLSNNYLISKSILDAIGDIGCIRHGTCPEGFSFSEFSENDEACIRDQH